MTIVCTCSEIDFIYNPNADHEIMKIVFFWKKVTLDLVINFFGNILQGKEQIIYGRKTS